MREENGECAREREGVCEQAIKERGQVCARERMHKTKKCVREKAR